MIIGLILFIFYIFNIVEKIINYNIKMTEVIDNNIDRNIIFQARTFLDAVCLNVIKLNYDEEKKSIIKFLAEEKFFRHLVDPF